MHGMMNGMGMGWGFWFFCIAGLLILFAMIFIFIWMGRGTTNDAMVTLKERLAKGEVSEEEYERLRRKIG